ncbi:F-box only protein 44-like [Liasis olivaceus]
MPQEGQWKTKELSGADALTYQAKDAFRRNRLLKKEDIPYEEVKKCFVASDGFYSGSGCRYRICVKLLSADFNVIKEICSGDVFEREMKTERWFKVSHIFDLTPGMGVRHVLFQHQGLYTNGKPPGDGGVKMTQSCITIGPYSFD